MKKSLFTLSVLSLSLGLSFASMVPAQAALPTQINGQPLPSLAPMLENVLPAVVSVQVEGTQAAPTRTLPEPFKRFFGDDSPEGDAPEQPFEGLGSGVIINAAKGYVLTNNHVVDGADTIRVQLADGREYDARLVGKDAQTDIALLQLNAAKNLVQIRVADSEKLKVGDFAVAIGNPFGLGQTATSGIISALGRSGLNLEGLENFIQTDAAINRGNSGGALVNLNGELIGINTAILSSSGGNLGIGFAIPANMAISLAQQLAEFGEVKRGQLGIKGTEMTADMANAFGVTAQRGAFVSEVLPGSAAAKAGIRSGDIITSVDGRQINSFAELRARIGTTAPGKAVQVGVLRGGKLLTLSVTLDRSAQAAASAAELHPALQGATLSDVKLKDGSQGIRVESVDKGTPAQQVGLHKDDVIVAVNRDRVQNLAELRKVLAARPPVMALNILRGGERLYLLLP